MLGAAAMIGIAALATNIALHGRWIAWNEPYGPADAPRTLARYEVTNAEFNDCDTCRSPDARGDPDMAICLGEADPHSRTVAVHDNTDAEGRICVTWDDAMDIADAWSRAYGLMHRCYRNGKWNKRCANEKSVKGFHLAAGEEVLRTAKAAREEGVLSPTVLDCRVKVAIPSPKPRDGSHVREGRERVYMARLGPARRGDKRAVQCITSIEAKRYANWKGSNSGMPPCYPQKGAETSEQRERERACRGYRLPSVEEWTREAPSGLFAGETHDGGPEAPQAARKLCMGEDAATRCTGAESGHELNGIDGTAPEELVGMTLGVREMVHAPDGLTTLGWSSIDARQHAEAVRRDESENAGTRRWHMGPQGGGGRRWR